MSSRTTISYNKRKLTSPCRDETTDVAHHDVGADTSRSRSIGEQVGSYLSIGQGTKGEGTRCDEEGGLLVIECGQIVRTDIETMQLLTPYLTCPFVVAKNMIYPA